MLFGRKLLVSGSLSDLILNAMNYNFSSQVAALWCSAIVNRLWVNWMTRNAMIFEVKVPNVHYSLRLIRKAIKEVDFFKVGCMLNSVDELTILRTLQIQGIPQRALQIISVLWQPLPSTWIKVNTYGLTIGNSRLAGVGGIF